MKKFALALTCFMGSLSLMHAQSPNVSLNPNAGNNPTVFLPAAYHNSTQSGVSDKVDGVNSITHFDLNTPIPFTGTYGSNLTGDLIYDNGDPRSVETNPPYGLSVLQSSLNMVTYGKAALSEEITVADDFVLLSSVEISEFNFFAYQTGETNFTIDGVFVRIWDGDPSDQGSVIWGDFNNNLLDRGGKDDTYRVLDTNLEGTSRLIQYVRAATPGLTLNPGRYWVEYFFTGTGDSGPWAPPITITDESTTGNALHYVSGDWLPYIDVGPQGLPFQIYGTEIPYDDCDQINPEDFTFSGGVNCSMHSEFQTANDLIVATGEDFTLTNITASIFANTGINKVNVIYYDDVGGFPGSIIGQEDSVTITSQSVIGSNFGYDVNEIALEVTPFVFNGQAGAPTTYWIELSVENGSSSFDVYWCTTSSTMVGRPTMYTDPVWQINNPDHDGVYIFEGNCEAMMNVNESTLTNFTYYPNPTSDVLHLNAAKKIENVAIYNMLGQQVIVSKIDALSSTINMSKLTPGTYMMKVTIDGITKSHKIIKK